MSYMTGPIHAYHTMVVPRKPTPTSTPLPLVTSLLTLDLSPSICMQSKGKSLTSS